MDKDEEAGLRAFALVVGLATGSESTPLPAWIERSGARVPVTAIDAWWREEERHGYRVRLADGSDWLLYYVPEMKLWSGILNGRSAEAP